jgi:hypothetical protein
VRARREAPAIARTLAVAAVVALLGGCDALLGIDGTIIVEQAESGDAAGAVEASDDSSRGMSDSSSDALDANATAVDAADAARGADGEGGSAGFDAGLEAETSAPCGLPCAEGGSVGSPLLLTSGDSEGLSRIVADGNGNFYIAGVYSGSAGISVGDAMVPAPQQGDAFLAKVDQSGNTVWLQALSGAGTVTVRDLIVDETGQIDLLGAFATDGTRQGAMSIGNSALTLSSVNIGTGWLFIASFDPSGDVLWADKLYDSDNPFSDDYFGQIARMAPGPNDILVLAPSLGSMTLTTGSEQNVNNVISSMGTSSNFVLVDLTLSGEFIGSFVFGCSETATVAALATADFVAGRSGIAYAAGNCPDLTFPSGSEAGGNSDEQGGFIVEIQETSAGHFEANEATGATVTALLGNPHDLSGYVYDTVGSAPDGGTFAVERRDPIDLGASWNAMATQTTGSSLATALAFDAEGDVVAAGPCTGYLSFDSTGVAGDVTGQGACVVAYDASQGTFRWDVTLPLAFGSVFRQTDVLGLAGAPANTPAPEILFGATVTSYGPDSGADAEPSAPEIVIVPMAP